MTSSYFNALPYNNSIPPYQVIDLYIIETYVQIIYAQHLHLHHYHSEHMYINALCWSGNRPVFSHVPTFLPDTLSKTVLTCHCYSLSNTTTTQLFYRRSTYSITEKITEEKDNFIVSEILENGENFQQWAIVKLMKMFLHYKEDMLCSPYYIV